MVRSRKDAKEASLKQTTNTPGTCQMATRIWYAAPSAGDMDRDGDYDAVDGWLKEPASAKHPGDRKPPAGVPLSFGGGSRGYGHRCISWDGTGLARSTDMKDGRYSRGNVGFATISEIEKSMNVHYLGWSETIDGYKIPADAPLPPKPAPVTKTPIGTTVHDIILATENVMSLPRNPDIHGTLAASSPASVVGLQEIDPIAFKAAAENFPHFDLVNIPKGNTYASGIMYDERVWTLKGHKYIKQYDGVNKISYTRHFCVARLHHKALNFDAIFISYHAVTAGGDTNRSIMRRSGLGQLRKVIRQYKKEGVPVFVFGDYNSRSVQHPSAAVKLIHGIDHIYLFNGKKVTGSKKRTRSVNTKSDHDTFIARFTMTVRK